jgi:GAF domain-containing protein
MDSGGWPRLKGLLEELRRLPGCGPLQRLSVALYDDSRNTLRTYASSGGSQDPLIDYEVQMAEVPSLAILAASDQPRIVDDLATYGRDTSEHTVALRAAGFRSSLTIPVSDGPAFVGFVFFNSTREGFFTPPVVSQLAPFSSSILAMVRRETGIQPAAPG